MTKKHRKVDVFLGMDTLNTEALKKKEIKFISINYLQDHLREPIPNVEMSCVNGCNMRSFDLDGRCIRCIHNDVVTRRLQRRTTGLGAPKREIQKTSFRLHGQEFIKRVKKEIAEKYKKEEEGEMGE